MEKLGEVCFWMFLVTQHGMFFFSFLFFEKPWTALVIATVTQVITRTNFFNRCNFYCNSKRFSYWPAPKPVVDCFPVRACPIIFPFL